MRVYHNISQEDKETWERMCKLECQFPHLDFCHVNDIPHYGDLSREYLNMTFVIETHYVGYFSDMLLCVLSFVFEIVLCDT